MATTGKPQKTEATEPTETPVDYMKDAPPARPYSEAITPEHRKFLETNGVSVTED
jgi:hypothetical protein